MPEAYSTALKNAQRELAEADAMAEALERKRAKLRQTVAVLQTLTGEQTEPPKSLTDAILLVLKGTREQEAVVSADIVSRLEQMGVAAPPRSVATILSRLVKEGRIMSYLDRPGGKLVAYEWKGSRTKSDAFNATKALAEMGRKG